MAALDPDFGADCCLFQTLGLYLGTREDWIAATIANLIGGCIFFWVDRYIFQSKQVEKWEIIKSGICHDCGYKGIVRRLTFISGIYDRTNDNDPQFRCPALLCKEAKRSAQEAQFSSINILWVIIVREFMVGSRDTEGKSDDL
jgi:hypothetical protein